MRRSLAAALLALSAFAADAHAGLVLYQGSFSTALTPRTGGPESFSGSFSFEFDESVVPTTGPQRYNPDLVSVSLDPIGGTTFTPANTGIEIYYYDGGFRSLTLGGTLNGVSGARFLTNDFFLSYTGPTLNGAEFTNATVTSTSFFVPADSVAPSSGIITAGPAVAAVPEPGAMVLGATGLPVALGFWLRRRRKDAAA